MINQQLRQLEALIHKQQFVEAESLCKELSDHPQVQPSILHRALLHIYTHTQQYSKAVALLKPEFLAQPNNRSLCDHLANIYQQQQDFVEAANCYQQYLALAPNDSEARYNYGFNLRHAGEFDQAIEQYQLALSLKISQPEEVLVNIAVIYSDHLNAAKLAKQHLEQALVLNQNYLPALFNLANLNEQSGNKQAACELFNKILQLEPNHFEALARLADAQEFSSEDSPIITKLQTAIQNKAVPATVKTDLLFALGKAMDGCANYSQAFDYYQQANQLNKTLLPEYIPTEFEQYVDELIRFFSNSWLSQNKTQSAAMPVFICGMFRSGSTLLEQILASHPNVSAGGELEYFVRKAKGELSPFPSGLNNLAQVEWQNMAKDYQSYLKKRHPQAKLITDKRPDNLFYLGLILAVFPKAKIIFTEREALDNYLSIYFHRLGSAMSYATDLKHIQHYHSQITKLKNHWQTLFSQNIYTVNYDELISQPKEQIEQLLSFIGLDWSDSCLNFHQLNNQVKTASVWQVRKPLYSTSSGRWRHYQAQLAGILPH
ncbi:tetratricopeptide repeat-containing sulfotransferase family protein [Paraglaciecola aestuariivivens]